MSFFGILGSQKPRSRSKSRDQNSQTDFDFDEESVDGNNIGIRVDPQNVTALQNKTGRSKSASEPDNMDNMLMAERVFYGHAASDDQWNVSEVNDTKEEEGASACPERSNESDESCMRELCNDPCFQKYNKCMQRCMTMDEDPCGEPAQNGCGGGQDVRARRKGMRPCDDPCGRCPSRSRDRCQSQSDRPRRQCSDLCRVAKKTQDACKKQGEESVADQTPAQEQDETNDPCAQKDPCANPCPRPDPCFDPCAQFNSCDDPCNDPCAKQNRRSNPCDDPCKPKQACPDPCKPKNPCQDPCQDPCKPKNRCRIKDPCDPCQTPADNPCSDPCEGPCVEPTVLEDEDCEQPQKQQCPPCPPCPECPPCPACPSPTPKTGYRPCGTSGSPQPLTASQMSSQSPQQRSSPNLSGGQYEDLGRPVCPDPLFPSCKESDEQCSSIVCSE